MVDAHVSGACVERHAGSSPVLGTDNLCRVSSSLISFTKKMNIAEIAQLVEHNLAKVGVASSSLVFRSIRQSVALIGRKAVMPRWRNGRRARFRCVCREACRFESCSGHAEIAQLVEHNLAKVRVASSSLVFRSASKMRGQIFWFLFFCVLFFPLFPDFILC